MKNLALLRKERKISQQELGNKIGLARNTICQYESGNRVPDVSTLILLADFFNVSTDYLLDRDERNQSPLSEAKQQLIDVIKVLSEEQVDFISYLIVKAKEFNAM